MRVVTFYSFKGGVGRTTALLNAAFWLAQMGRKVVIADWDLQAPGLTLMNCMLPISKERNTPGVLEYLTGLRDGETVLMSDIVVEPSLSVDAHKARTPDGRKWMNGDLFFIPAGNLSQATVSSFIETAGNELHDLRSFFGKHTDQRFVFKVFCEDLKNCSIPWRSSKATGAPDYLLVDCRTGITEISDLLLGDATDLTMMVYAQDEQNFDGLKMVMNAHPRGPWELAATTMCIWTMEPPGQEELKFERQKRIDTLIEAICRKDTLGVREAFPEEYEVPYHPQLPLLSVPISFRFPGSDIAQRFLKIAKKIEERCLSDETITDARTGILSGGDEDTATRLKQNTAARLKKTLQTESEGSRRDIDRAKLDIELARELLPFLFSPPKYNLTGKPTREVFKWPDGCDADDCEVAMNLVAYTISLDRLSPEEAAIAKARAADYPMPEGDLPGEDFDRTVALERFPHLAPKGIRDFRMILCEERRKFLTMPANHYWELLQKTLASALEWLCIVQTRVARPARLKKVMNLLLAGKSIPSAEISSHPLFRLLTAQAIGSVASKGSSLLRAYVEREGDITEMRHALLAECCRLIQRTDLPSDVKWFCWNSLGISRHQLGRRETDNRRTRRQWLRDAREATEKALEMWPEETSSLIQKGIVLHDLARCSSGAAKIKKYDESIASFKLAIGDGRTVVRAYNELGVSLRSRGEESANSAERDKFLGEAETAFRRGIELGEKMARRNLARLHARFAELTDDLPTARKWRRSATDEFMKASQSELNSRSLLQEFAHALIQQGRIGYRKAERRGCFQAAFDIYSRLCRLDPESAPYLNNGVSVLLRQYHIEENAAKREKLLAEADWMIRQAMAIKPAEARYNYACVLARQGEKAKCFEQLAILVKDEPDKRADIADDVDFEAVKGTKRFRELISPRKGKTR